MNNLSAFLLKNAETVPNKKIVISNRFKDDKGNPIEWEIKCISSDENEELQRRSMVNVPVAGRPGMKQREMDQIKYTALLLAASVVFPDLDNAELQDSYGVKTPDALLKKMLYPKEYTYLSEQVVNFSNEDNINDLVEEAKN